ncbi:hypothetical protein Pelo_3783 [Pelomyxa schiedti]|nr:hypothetical protein Pelo_3783 [Pelomyxa schiedti]
MKAKSTTRTMRVESTPVAVDATANRNTNNYPMLPPKKQYMLRNATAAPAPTPVVVLVPQKDVTKTPAQIVTASTNEPPAEIYDAADVPRGPTTRSMVSKHSRSLQQKNERKPALSTSDTEESDTSEPFTPPSSVSLRTSGLGPVSSRATKLSSQSPKKVSFHETTKPPDDRPTFRMSLRSSSERTPNKRVPIIIDLPARRKSPAKQVSPGAPQSATDKVLAPKTNVNNTFHNNNNTTIKHAPATISSHQYINTAEDDLGEEPGTPPFSFVVGPRTVWDMLVDIAAKTNSTSAQPKPVYKHLVHSVSRQLTPETMSYATSNPTPQNQPLLYSPVRNHTQSTAGSKRKHKHESKKSKTEHHKKRRTDHETHSSSTGAPLPAVAPQIGLSSILPPLQSIFPIEYPTVDTSTPPPSTSAPIPNQIPLVNPTATPPLHRLSRCSIHASIAMKIWQARQQLFMKIISQLSPTLSEKFLPNFSMDPTYAASLRMQQIFNTTKTQFVPSSPELRNAVHIQPPDVEMNEKQTITTTRLNSNDALHQAPKHGRPTNRHHIPLQPSASPSTTPPLFNPQLHGPALQAMSAPFPRDALVTFSVPNHSAVGNYLFDHQPYIPSISIPPLRDLQPLPQVLSAEQVPSINPTFGSLGWPSLWSLPYDSTQYNERRTYTLPTEQAPPPEPFLRLQAMPKNYAW